MGSIFVYGIELVILETLQFRDPSSLETLQFRDPPI